MRISKWGNSLAVRIPADLARELDLKENDEILLRPLSPSTLGVEKVMSREEALRQLSTFKGRIADMPRFDRDDAHERTGHERTGNERTGNDRISS